MSPRISNRLATLESKAPPPADKAITVLEFVAADQTVTGWLDLRTGYASLAEPDPPLPDRKDPAQ